MLKPDPLLASTTVSGTVIMLMPEGTFQGFARHNDNIVGLVMSNRKQKAFNVLTGEPVNIMTLEDKYSRLLETIVEIGACKGEDLPPEVENRRSTADWRDIVNAIGQMARDAVNDINE